MKDVGPLLALATTSTPRRSEKEKAQRREQSRIYRKKYPAKVNAAAKAWRDANPEKRADTVMMTKYGITVAERDTLFKVQGCVCAICKTDSPDIRGWAVDHCHGTNEVRGILCHPCNLILGNAGDNTATLAAAITYLSH